jgi:tetratricopeptide (TPR) repeat protein
MKFLRVVLFPIFLSLALSSFAQSSKLPPGSTTPPAPGQTPAVALSAIENDIASGNFNAAESRLDSFLAKNPQNDRAFFDLGYCEDAQDHTDAAATDFRKALAINPHQFESHLALGLLLARKGDQEAQKQLQAATQSTPNPPNPAATAQAYRALARLLVQSDPTSASNDLAQALKLTPETTRDTLLAAQIAENAGDNDIAETEYQKVLAKSPSNSQAIAGLTQLYIQQKQYAKAEPLVRSALDRDPDDPALNAQLAAILSAQGKLPEAIGALEKLHQLHPHNPSVGAMLADAYLQAGNLNKAAALYPQVIASDPKNAGLLDSYGQVLIRQHQYAPAINQFRKATQLNPSDVDAWSGIAFASSETSQYQQELDALLHRARLTPDTPATLFLRATAYDHLHQAKQAIDYYHRFLAAAPAATYATQIWQAKHRLNALVH